VRLSEHAPPFESRIEHLSEAEAEEFLKPYLKRPKLGDYERDFRYFCKHAEELTAQYPDEWIAIYNCKVVAHSPQHDNIWSKLEQLGLRDKSPLIELLETNPPTLIL
jgi:hypothetical protein